MDMSFVFSITQERKEQLEKFKKIVGIVSIPIAIEAYAWFKALQTGISLINYLCTVDDVMKLSDALFKFRGPVVISDVYDKVFLNDFFNPQNNLVPKPRPDASYLSSDTSSKIIALNRFKGISTVIGNQIKIIKEPITEI